MKATLTFKLPEEREEFEMASQCHKLYSVICDFDHFLRNKIKHADLTDEQYAVYDTIRQELWNRLTEENLNLY